MIPNKYLLKPNQTFKNQWYQANIFKNQTKHLEMNNTQQIFTYQISKINRQSRFLF